MVRHSTLTAVLWVRFPLPLFDVKYIIQNKSKYFSKGARKAMSKTGKKVLVIVDVQNDFINGSLGNDMTKAVLPKIVKKLKKYGSTYNSIFLTRDIHYENYLDTLEGKKLPINHCLANTKGKDIVKEVWDVLKGLRKEGKFVRIIDKHTFASAHLMDYLSATCGANDEIELIGVCTDICVVNNALCLRMALPNTVIKVDANCCAGTNMKAHNAALRTMASCQIDIIGRHYGKKSDEQIDEENTTEVETEDVNETTEETVDETNIDLDVIVPTETY